RRGKGFGTCKAGGDNVLEDAIIEDLLLDAEGPMGASGVEIPMGTYVPADCAQGQHKRNNLKDDPVGNIPPGDGPLAVYFLNNLFSKCFLALYMWPTIFGSFTYPNAKLCSARYE
ncbi:hypothetical protein ACJX0J_016135, partial [Zea mays]